MNTGQIVGLGVAGLGVWWLGNQLGWFGGAPAIAAPGAVPGGSAAPAATPPSQPLTAGDAATFPYSAAVTSTQISSIDPALVAALQAGQIPTIAPGSVLAYMLGWGGSSAAGQVQSAGGYNYQFDGANWQLQGKTAGSPPPAPSLPPVPSIPAAAGGGSAVLPIVSGVTKTLNNALKATVTFQGAPISISIIPNSWTVWNDAGQNITSKFAGVNIQALYNQFKSVSGLSGYGMGAMVFTTRRNYVRKPRFA